MNRSASTRRRIYMANSIAPVPQARPPFWLVLIAFAVAVAPVAGFVLWAWA